MYKRYFRKKNPLCRTEEIEWIEMTGREFYAFVNAPENQGRHFVDMDTAVLECTAEQYKAFMAEDDHTKYLREQEEGWETTSLYCLEADSGCNGEEVIADETQDVEAAAIFSTDKRNLEIALSRLDSESYSLIYALYLASERKTERQLAVEYGVSQIAVHKRKKKILKNLNLWLSNRKKVPNRK